MKKIFLTTLLTLSFVYSESRVEVEKLIGNMFMVGFFGTKINANSQITKDIKRYNLGGVILFDRNPINKSKPKNISSPKQVKALSSKLQKYANGRLLIAVDQEGGRVQRLSPKNGFSRKYSSPSKIVKSNNFDEYNIMAKELNSVGVNFNLAPVVDLAINPKNRVIVKLGRSYGKNPSKVVSSATKFIKSMSNQGVLTSLKHFPGHGSSLGDTHKGFVDITNTWQKSELIPYKKLINSGMVDTIMVAHVINGQIDKKYPASLSNKTINKLLRGKMGYDGVVISDDLQMYAISKHYNLRNTIKLSINAGVDIMLFGNQLSPKKILTTKKLVDTTYSLYKSGEISLSQLKIANDRINKLKSRL
ncbi:Beta-hexosaminidase [hydrothermal vent metagenome]|uniref:beta-N-acetylhexosaminidase n=1 Tax=hydrothermal vent metagenome TaxID=652676 RepID=A0A1W1EIF3_9ZZZZ